jgi:ABC-2 type transport system ATP-binding protein
MPPAIEIKNLSKRYGSRLAVDNLSLTINAGEIFGFVGPNGAGKTSTIRIIAGLLQASSGDIFVSGYSVRNSLRDVKRQIGYMPDFFGVYLDLKVWEYLDFFSACYQIPESERQKLIDGLLELVDLSHRKQDLVDKLSRGLKQRLSLARTLLHDPQVLVLDEPAAGLDPRARVEIRELLIELANMGKTIFFSTHILADVAEICSHVGIIEAGKLIGSGSLEELHEQTLINRHVSLVLIDHVQKAQELLQKFESISSIEVSSSPENGDRHQIEFEFSGDDLALSEILTHLIQNDISVLHFSEDKNDLEAVFLGATNGLVT